MAPNTEGTTENYAEVAFKRYKEKKTHISFPQLKYPSLRDVGLRDPVQWLEGKALDDGAEGLWRVHDKIYDISSFADTHPGGAEWFELTKGTDITEAFESHHLNPAVEKMLDKYYVKDATTPRNSPLTFHEGGFYKTLRATVREELKKLPESETKRSKHIIDGLVITLFVTSALTCWAQNAYVVYAAYILAAYALASAVVASHNYIHRRSNWRMYVFNLSGWSYRDFRVTHALSHHMYPNLANDIEVSGFEPFVYWNPAPDKPFYANFAFFIQCAMFPFGFIINFLKRFFLNFIRKDFFKKHYKWHEGICFILPLWMWLVSGAPLAHVITNWLWINCTGSLIFYTVGSNAAHHHPEIFKEGDEVTYETRDWGIHEVETLMDRRDINSSFYRVMTFFGDHTLHHLFPTVDHAYLKYLYPKFLELCKKYKANFRESTQLEMFVAQLRMAAKREFTLAKDRKKMS